MIRFLLILGIIPLFVVGAMNAITPENTFGLNGVAPSGIMALSTIRGDIGGLLLGVVLLMILGLITHNKTWYHATLVVVSTVLAGRFLSAILDGWSNDLLPPVLLEVYIIAVLIFAARQLDASHK